MGWADGGIPLCLLYNHLPPPPPPLGLLEGETEPIRHMGIDHEVPQDLAQFWGHCQHVGNKTEQ